MSIILKINYETEFQLVDWDAKQFVATPQLKIASNNLTEIKQAFEDIDKIQVFQDGILVGETTQYETYDSIQYLGTVFSPAMNQFVECLQVDLAKTSLVEQVDRLTAEIFPVVDFSTMTVEEYKAWLLEDIAKQCRDDIYAGTVVNISSGAKHFSYTMEDQQNLQSMAALLMSVPELPAMPYHADGELCYLMPKADILTVYLTLHMRLLALTTRYNHMNMWIRSMQTKEEMQGITYTTPLPDEYQDQVNAILARAIEMEELLRAAYLPQQNSNEPTEDPAGENEETEEPIG